MPRDWDVVGMGVVDSLTQLVISAGNAAISAYTLKSQVVIVGLGSINSGIRNKDMPGGWDVVGMGMVDSLTQSTHKDMPSGWDIVGMGVVDSLAQLALKSQVAAAGLGAFNSVTGNGGDKNVQIPTAPVNSSPDGLSSLPNDNSLTDPVLLETPIVLQLANALQQLISGGEGGKPDWEKIRPKDAVCIVQSFTSCTFNPQSCSPVQAAPTTLSCLYNPPRKAWTEARTYRHNSNDTSPRVSTLSMLSLI
jgi:hypothetical protein